MSETKKIGLKLIVFSILFYILTETLLKVNINIRLFISTFTLGAGIFLVAFKGFPNE